MSDSFPENMRSMADVRREVDRIDAELIARLAERFQCMDAAARIKADRGTVRDETRKAEVLANVKRLAGEAKLPVPTVAAIWELLVETSISYELEKWDQLRED